MGALKAVFYTSSVISAGGLFLVHRELGQLYPDINVYKLPQNSRIHTTFNINQRDPSRYIAYCDTYKIRIITDKSIQGVTSELLSFPLLARNIINIGSNEVAKPKSLVLQSEVVDQKLDKKQSYESTLIRWAWTSTSIVSWYEKLASYGFPWRLMNGGFHEIYVEKIGEGHAPSGETHPVYEVYFASAHEYNFLRDGKVIPAWVQTLHRDYAKVVLHLSLAKYKYCPPKSET